MPTVGAALFVGFLVATAVDAKHLWAAAKIVPFVLVPILLVGVIAFIKGRMRWREVVVSREGLEVTGAGPQAGEAAWDDMQRVQCIGFHFFSQPGLLVTSRQGELFIHKQLRGYAELTERLRQEAETRGIPFEHVVMNPGRRKA